MLDPIFVRILKSPLERGAELLRERGLSANQVTLIGFAAGALGAVAVAGGYYVIAILLLAINRVADGLDGALARLTKPTDFGAYLDMVLDFVIFSAVAGGFAVARPENALAGVVLVASLMGLATTFLAFAVIAGERGFVRATPGERPFSLMGGLIENTETAAFFLIVLVWHSSFPTAAWIFSALCWVTMGQRFAEARATFERG